MRKWPCPTCRWSGDHERGDQLWGPKRYQYYGPGLEVCDLPGGRLSSSVQSWRGRWNSDPTSDCPGYRVNPSAVKEAQLALAKLLSVLRAT